MAHSPYDITLDSTVVKQIRNLQHNTEAQVVPAYASGEASPAALFQGQTPHKSTATSTDLATLLALNTSTFISAGVSYSSANCDIPFRQRSGSGAYSSGGSHLALRSATQTLVVPDTISASEATSATCNFTLRYKSSETDGSGAPVTVLSGQTLSTATFNGEYVLRKVTIGGTAVDELESVTINTGIEITEDFNGGNPFPTAFYAFNKQPSIEISTTDMGAVTDAIAAAGLGAGVVVYFAKRASGGTTVADATTDHISVTAASGLHQAQTFGGDDRANSTGTIRVNPLALTAAVGVAIS